MEVIDLNNCFIYGKWALNLNACQLLRWNVSNVYHLCNPDEIRLTWNASIYSMFEPRRVKEMLEAGECRYRNVCQTCNMMTTAEESKVLQATNRINYDT